MADVTHILNAIERGDPQAAEELLPLVYEELRRLASHKMSQEPPGQTLQATALVHEAYIRLVGSQGQNWSSHAHFFNAAAEAMRRILIDNARRKQRLKHGNAKNRIELDSANIVIEDSSIDHIALDEALTKLVKEEPVVSELVKLRYFAGLTLNEAASVLGVSNRTADRYWKYAKAWLFQEISTGDKPTSL
jgi:RNA polymerase sigma factor (TIGR02999 family)